MSAIMFRECHIDNVIFFLVNGGHVNSLPNLKMMLVSWKLINSFEIGHFVPYLELESTIYHTRGKNAHHYTTDAIRKFLCTHQFFIKYYTCI